MRKVETIIVLSVILLSFAGTSIAQTFGTLMGGGASSDGEGSVFLLAGNDAFRTGIAARFNITRVADFGIQLGLDRVCETSFWGGGGDLKLVLLESRKNLPLNLALDASLGKLDSRDVKQFLFAFGILASGIIETSQWRTVEPYLSFLVLVKQVDRDAARGSSLESCLCPTGEDDTDAETLVRAGVKLSLTRETQLLLETELGDHALFGAGFNVVF